MFLCTFLAHELYDYETSVCEIYIKINGLESGDQYPAGY